MNGEITLSNLAIILTLQIEITTTRINQDKDTPNTKIYGLIRYTRHEYARFHDWIRKHIELFYDRKKQENRKLVEEMVMDYYKFAPEIGEVVTSVTVTTTVTRN